MTGVAKPRDAGWGSVSATRRNARPSLGQPRVLPGRPYPLGATWDGKGVNFALFSQHGERVELCLFDSSGQREVDRIALPEHTDHVWHGYLPEAGPGLLYGYRVYGPYEPQNGHRFNANKLLIDPYARQLVGELRWTEAHYGYRVGTARADLTFDKRDNARSMPKGLVVDPAFTWGGDRPLDRPWSETVIYEAHVRGLTVSHPALPQHLRGTFGGLAAREVVSYLKALGITAIELLPVHAFVDDHFLVRKGLRNYWGYSTLNYFAPVPRYMASSGLGELKTAVKRLHDAGIEVLLDVVYNHTCEGNHLGPTLSFKGIDNASYYRLLPTERRYYIDETGTGNTVNLSHPRVLQMVLDSLRYWVQEIHVDGFRFDLATTLGREPQGYDPGSGFFDAVRQDPVLSQVKLIAEPWDVGPGGYQLGNYPPGWAEWNDRYRDGVRRFWRGDHGMLPDMAGGLAGSSHLFEHNGRRSWSSINYCCSHDGFTLADLVSYEQKHNNANGEDGRDGHNANFSMNHGVEGPTDNPEILELRARQHRNFLATVLFSQGTPMILAGDEFGRTQNGNNNAYCQDNEISWINWEEVDERARRLLAFTRQLVALRKAHPVLRRPRFLHGRDVSPRGIPDMSWIDPDGNEKSDESWGDHYARCVGLLLAGDAGDYMDDDGRDLVDDVLLVLLNAHVDSVPFTLPHPAGVPGRWYSLIDTAAPERTEGAVSIPAGNTYPIQARSLVLFRFDPAD